METNLSKIYGEDNEKLLAYEREKELIRKRDETKAELKALLKKYVSQQNIELGEEAVKVGRGYAWRCADRVGNA
jgi:hypothetical protein